MPNQNLSQENSPKSEKITSFSPPRGIRDLLPKEQKYWQYLQKIALEVTRVFGFQRIDVPTFESAGLFNRTVGTETDIVAKELYFVSAKTELKDEKIDERLALRPEFTAGICRAYISGGMQSWPQPVKLWTSGPIFRHEKPQNNRYREHYQLDLEIIGDEWPKADAWIILTCWQLLKDCGLENIEIQINSLGNSQSQEKYRKKLSSFYKPLLNKLCPTCQERYQKNILRILDCKEEGCQKFKEEAPKTVDNLDDISKNHFMTVLTLLDSFNINYNLNPYIVRGLDYYSHTCFEIIANEFDGEGSDKTGGSHKIALGGGGRYDGLIEQIGGPPTFGVGCGLGMDRLVEEMKMQKVQVAHPAGTEIFVAGIGPRAIKRSTDLVIDLLRAGFNCEFAPDKQSIRAQFKVADKLEAAYTIIIGEKEAHDNTCIIRDMKSGIQEDASCDELVSILRERLR